MPEDRLDDLEDEDDVIGHGDRFRAHFALPASERLKQRTLISTSCSTAVRQDLHR
jgi:hypothetical protein